MESIGLNYCDLRRPHCSYQSGRDSCQRLDVVGCYLLRPGSGTVFLAASQYSSFTDVLRSATSTLRQRICLGYRTEVCISTKAPVPLRRLVTSPTAFGTLDHHVHRQRRSAVKGFVSKRTVRTAQVSIRETIEELCSIITQSAAKKDVFDCNLQFLAWSTDSVNRFLDCSPMGLLHDVGRAIEWKQTIRAVVELTPLVKQFPLVMPMVLHLPQWLVRAFSPDLNRILIMHKVWCRTNAAFFFLGGVAL